MAFLKPLLAGIFFSFASVAVPALVQAADYEVITGVAHVIHGDTLEIDGMRIRLHGVDAPEQSQSCIAGDGRKWACGAEATFALANLAGAKSVTCKQVSKLKDGNFHGSCQIGKHDLSAMLVFQGWAIADRRRSKDYVNEELDAKEHMRGLWRGNFVEPWVWRDKQK